MIDVIGGWLLNHDWTLEAAAWVLLICAVGTLLLIAYGVLHVLRHAWNATRWAAGYLRHHWDLHRMNRWPTPPPPSGDALDNYWTCCRAWAKPTREESKR